MKINKLFTAALAAMTLLASCSKENGADIDGGNAAKMNVRISYDEASTYTLDTPQTSTNKTQLTNAVLYQMVGTNVFMATELDAASLGQMTSPTGLQIENVNSTVDGVMIVGNVPVAKMTAMKALLTKTTIEAYAIDIADVQPTTTNVGVKGVTIMGFGAAIAAGNATDGHAIKKAAVTAAPIVARMEIAGTVVNSTENENQIQAIVWKNVYFNRYYTTYTKDVMKNFGPTEAWDTVLPAWAKDVYTTATEPKTKCYAYHFFPAVAVDASTLPMFVMKADLTLKDGRTLTDQYITVKVFKKNNSPMTQMMPNKIYKVDLAGLTVDHTDFTPDPNPEQTDLGVTVTITDWTVEDITPSID